MATSNKPAKTMSSRLMTMKFMQRAAGSPPSTPSTPSEPATKKQRLSNGAYRSSPAATPKSEARVIEDALAAEEQKRTEPLEREAADRGETKWYLSFEEPQAPAIETPLRVVSAGYSSLDGSGREPPSEKLDIEDARPSLAGRRSFGNFNRAPQKAQKDEDSSTDEPSESEEDERDEDDPTGAKALIKQSRKEAGEKARADRKAKRKVEKTESLRMAEDRRKTKVKLNQLDSISGVGGKSSNYERDMTCFNCGQKGHAKANCSRSRRNGRER